MERESLPYRRNVAIVLVNGEGKILACHRSDIDGAWQLPQGGIEAGEEPAEAMLRELKEETGVDNVEIIGSLPETIRYEWPEYLFVRGYRGQEQLYFLARLKGSGAIHIPSDTQGEQEFNRVEWLSGEEFLERVHGFKAQAYRRAIEELKRQFPGVIA